MNEAETRYHLIDPQLRAKGYVSRDQITLETILTPAPVEPTGAKGRRRKGAGRTDYLLCVQVGDMPKLLPVAVLEAKKESADPLKGMQQAKSYADCERFDVKYVFATNGHLYGEFDLTTMLQAGTFLFADFPPHPDLSARYAKDIGIDIAQPGAAMLFQADSPAWAQSRYYQDAAIRAAFEKIIRCQQNNEPARVLLTLATGAGKTIIATNLLWRLSKAGQLPKPALFLCDRDELRTQAYNKLKAAFGDSARVVETKQGGNAARRAQARAEMQPLLDEAAQIKAAVIDLKEQLKRLKKDKASDAELGELEAQIREKDKAAHELETKANTIDAAVFDLKAVNPTAVANTDARTPQQIIDNIEAQGRIVSGALAKLAALMAAAG